MRFKFQAKIIVTLVFLLTGTVVMAQQQLVLSGQLKERATNLVLPSGSLVLTGTKDTVRIVSDASGMFSFHHLKPGKYRLISTYVSFIPDTVILQLKKDTALVIRMKSDSRELAEVHVRSKLPPVVIRNDTVAFNTQAYPTPPNATVEDLLRRLPGMRMDADGNVTFQGRKVDKILINGRSFFINDLRKATHNLPADIISQVELSDSQSDENKLANISDISDTKTINLKLKKNKSNGWLGKSFADYGTAKSYAAGGDITHLDSINLFSATGLTSNVGNGFSGSAEDEPAFQGQNHAAGGSLLYQRVMSKRLTLNAGFKSDYQNRVMENNDFKTTYLGDSTLISRQGSTSSELSHNYEIEGIMIYKPDEHTTLEASTSYDLSTTNSNNLNTTLAEVEKMQQTGTSSIGTAANNNSLQNNGLRSEWTLTHRFTKEHRAIIFKLNVNDSNNPQQAGINTNILTYNPADTTIVNQRSQDSGHHNQYAANVFYNEPVGKKNNIRIGYGWSYVSDHSAKRSADYNIADGQYDIPDTLTSDQFEAKQSTNSLSLMFGNLPGAKLRYEFSTRLQSIVRENQDFSLGTDLKHHDVNLVPVAKLVYTLKQGETINLNYFGSSVLPLFDQLQPIPDLTNPYLVKIGNPDLLSSFTHDIALRLTNFNSKNSHSLTLELRAQLTEDPISETSTVLPGGVQQVKYVNTGPDYQLSNAINYDLPVFGQNHGNNGIGANFNYGHSENIVNGLNSLNIDKSAGVDYHVSYNTGDKFFADVNTGLTYVNNSYSLPGLMAARSWQQHYVINLTWQLPMAFSMKVHYNHQFTSNNGIPDQQMNFLTASLAKDILGGHACQIRLSGYNLLNAQSDITQVAGPNFIDVSRTDIISKMILLSFVYHFENLKGGGAN